MNILMIILLLVIIAAVVWLARQPAELNIERTRVIKASPEKLCDTVCDFKTWPHWSAWLMHEPDTQLEYSAEYREKGGWYAWNGKLVGAGKMTHLDKTPLQSIQQKIEFTRPMRSQGDVYWKFRPVDSGTEVTWGMRSHLPFFLRWLAPMISEGVSKDYDIGLGKLAQFVGDATDPFDIGFAGMVEMPEETYIAKHYEGSLADLPAAAQTHFPQLMQAVAQHGLEQTGMPFTLLHQFDKKKQWLVCDMAIPVKEAKVAGGFNAGKLAARRYFRTTLKGDYSHLELAWYAAFSHVRMRKLKVVKSAPMVERYASDPQVESGLGVVTFIDLPVG
jgi:DNA gyrase inhibitor GyrI